MIDCCPKFLLALIIATEMNVAFAVTQTASVNDSRVGTSSSKLPIAASFYNEQMIKRIWYSNKLRTLVSKASKEPGDGETPLVRGIYNSESLDGYCAMVQLLVWYNDGAASETVDYNITKRGTKILPVLEYALIHPNIKLDKEKEAHRLLVIKGCIDAIKRGEITGYDE